MTQTTVKLQITFESLVEAIASLGLEQKRQLWQLLDREIQQSDAGESDPYDWGPRGQPEGKPKEQLQLPALAQLCGAYFHQNWDLEAPDALGVIRNYLKDEPISQILQTIEEIDRLISLNLEPEQLKNLLESDLKCCYNPAVYGISDHSWLLWVQISLKQSDRL